MIFDFYTDDSSKYTVDNHKLLRNGEVLATGSIFFFQLLTGYPAFLIISNNAFIQPTTIKTSSVNSVLPEFEFFDGKQCPEKRFYEMQFSLTKYSHRIKTYSCWAIDQVHAETLLRIRFGSQIDIYKIRELEKSNTIKRESLICC